MSEASPQAWREKVALTFREHPWVIGGVVAATLGFLLFWLMLGGGHRSSGRPHVTVMLDEKRIDDGLLGHISNNLERMENVHPDNLTPLMERVNQWLAPERRQMTQLWQIDPMARPFVPEDLANDLGQLRFRVFANDIRSHGYQPDTFPLAEAVWLNNVANSQLVPGEDDVRLATRLFDWVIRNIQVDDPVHRPIWQSWQAVLFGHGEPIDRAWVFMLLARQMNLDVVLLAYPDAQNPQIHKVWLPALVHEGQLYLFDHNLGLPIPGPDGEEVATLEQVVADPQLLRKLDIGERFVYPVKSADLQNLMALIEASPLYLTRRARILEGSLRTTGQVVLSVDPTRIAQQVTQCKHIARAQVWDLPFVRLQNLRQPDQDFETWRRRLDAIEAEMSAFYIDVIRRDYMRDDRSITPEDIRRHVERNLDQNEDESKSDKDREEIKHVAAALWKGRLLQFKAAQPAQDTLAGADFSRQETATHLYQLVRLTDKELQEMQLGINLALNRAHQELQRLQEAELPEQEKQEYVQRIHQFGARLQSQAQAMDPARQSASYWLGIVAFERGDYSSAIEYFRKHVLAKYPDGPWTRGARYNLARSLEAAGNWREAIDLYDGETSPMRHGVLLRARMLREKHGDATAAN